MIKLTIDEERCKGCGLCVNACPKGLLSISTTKENAKSYNPAEISKMEECIGCKSCALTCPDVCIEIVKE